MVFQGTLVLFFGFLFLPDPAVAVAVEYIHRGLSSRREKVVSSILWIFLFMMYTNSMFIFS